MREYFSALWAPDDIVEVRAIYPRRDGPGPKSVWARAGEWAGGANADWMAGLNGAGWNIYAGILPRIEIGARGNASACPGSAVWADIDNITPTEASRRLRARPLPPPSVVVNTGHGVQCYWLLTEKRPPAELRVLVGAIATALDSDPSVRNEERVLRIPGYTNHKPPVANSTLLLCDTKRRYAIEDIRRVVSEAAAMELSRRTAPIPGTAGIGAAPAPFPEDSIIERARRYIATVPGSGPGGRTNTAFRVAAVLVRDYALDPALALDILARWDRAANSPPIAADPMYGSRELERIVANAGKYGRHAEGELIAMRPGRDGFDAEAFVLRMDAARDDDVTGEVALADDTADVTIADDGPPAAIADPGPFPEHLLRVPGFIGDFARFIDEKNPKSQPVPALGAAIAAMGTLTGRKVEGATGLRTNFYVLNVIPSGEGKNAPREQLSRLLHDPDNLFYYTVDRLKSGAGIRSALEVNPCVIFILDEIGEWLEMIKTAKGSFWIKEIIPELMSLYSSAASPHVKMGGYSDAKKTIDLNCPHVCLYGTSVPESFYKSMTMQSVTNGFIGRLSIFEGAAENPVKKRPTREPIPDSILDAAKWWREFAPHGMLTGTHAGSISKPILVDESAEATAIFDNCEAEARKNIEMYGRQWGGPYNRMEENARKYAIAYACSECPGSPFIGRAAAKWGTELSLYLTHRLVYIADMNVADNDTHDKRNKVRRIIVAAGEKGISRNELTRKTQFLEPRELGRIVDALMISEEIRLEETKTKTKSRIMFFSNSSNTSRIRQDAKTLQLPRSQ